MSICPSVRLSFLPLLNSCMVSSYLLLFLWNSLLNGSICASVCSLCAHLCCSRFCWGRWTRAWTPPRWWWRSWKPAVVCRTRCASWMKQNLTGTLYSSDHLCIWCNLLPSIIKKGNHVVVYVYSRHSTYIGLKLIRVVCRKYFFFAVVETVLRVLSSLWRLCTKLHQICSFCTMCPPTAEARIEAEECFSSLNRYK